MKRFFAGFLTVCLLFAAVSCQSIAPATTETDTVPESSVPESTRSEGLLMTTKIADPLTWDDINSIPVAKAGMTIRELRQISVDLFRMTQTIPWVANQDIDYTITSGNRKVHIDYDVRMGGLPYITEAAANNIYTFMQYYDSETGILDVAGVGGKGIAFAIGNHCSSGALWGWTRVVNSADCQLTTSMNLNHGCIPVGPYQYDATRGNWNDENNTHAVVAANGEQTMFESYAATELGDGLVQYRPSGGGHAMMISEDPIVTRRTDGSIDGDNSFLIILEQGNAHEKRTLPDGEEITYIGGVDRKISFATFFKQGYLPFTFAEFLGTDPVENGEATLDMNSDTASFDTLNAASVVSNYAISDIELTILDSQGNVLVHRIGENRATNLKTMKLSQVLLPHMKSKAAEGNTIRLDCRISTGEIFTVFNGPFLP